MTKTAWIRLAACLLLAVPAAHAVAWEPDAEQKERAAVDEAIKEFLKAEPRLKAYFDQAYGYAVFPSVDKGGFIVGGAYGKGKVFQGGKIVANTSLSQGTVGLQLGFQSYAEVIFFGDKAAFEAFKKGEAKFAANATAYAIKDGAAAVANYNDGVAVFVKGKSGLMADASLGAQTFSYDPI